MRTESRGVQIEEGLTPLGTIHHRANLTGRLHATPVDFDCGQLPKAGAVGQAGKIGQRARLHLLLPFRARCARSARPRPACVPRPSAPAGAAHRAIHTQHHSVGAGWRERRVAQDAFGCRGLDRDSGRAGGLGNAGGAGAVSSTASRRQTRRPLWRRRGYGCSSGPDPPASKASIGPAASPIRHRGGKSPPPQAGQTP